MRKDQKKTKKGPRGTAKGKKRSFTGHQIRQASTDEREDDKPDGIEEVDEDPGLTTIRALMKNLSTNECLKILAELNEQDF